MQTQTDRVNPTVNSQTPHSSHVPFFVPLLNPLIRGFLRAGIPLGPMVLLTVKGRKTGKARTTPVGLFTHNGQRYLFATFGPGDWVQNLRKAEQATIRKVFRKQRVATKELTHEEAVPILRDFVAPMLAKGLAGKIFGRYYKSKLDSPISDFMDDALHHPVFRVIDASLGN